MSSHTLMLTPEQLPELFPEAIWSTIPERLLTLQDPSAYSNNTARHNALLSQIALEACVDWLNSYELDNPLSTLPDNLPTVWEVVDGCLIRLGNTRIAVIPSEEFDEISVPAEWVDIPAWSADYYIPVHIDLETRQVCLWGYTTHQYIKENIACDPIYQNYYIDRVELVERLDILWTARELGLNERVDIAYTAEAIAPQLIEQLSQPSLYSPRLDVSFNQWASLLENEATRQQLYQQRLANASSVTSLNQTVTRTVINLSEWLRKNFDQALENGWQTIDTLLGPEASHSFARSGRNNDTIERAKFANFKFQLEEISLVVNISLTPSGNDESSVLVRIYPRTGVSHLPSDLTISLMDDVTSLQSVTSRSDDKWIQLRVFQCTANTFFTLKLELNGVSLVDDFMLDDIPDSSLNS